MQSKDQHAEKKRGSTRSSITVSGEIACEDDACIGREVEAEDVSTTDQAKFEKRKGKSSGTSMSIGGKEVCFDDACIGKK